MQFGRGDGQAEYVEDELPESAVCLGKSGAAEVSARTAELTESIVGFEKDVSIAQANPKSVEGFIGIEIQGTYHFENETAGKAILTACSGLQELDSILLGQYRGFPITLLYVAAHADYKLMLKGVLLHITSLGADVFGNITRLDRHDGEIGGISGGITGHPKPAGKR